MYASAIRATGLANLRRRTMFRTLLVLAAATAGHAARAQDVPNVISPLRIEADHNNVNLIDGKTTIEVPVLSVPAAPNLRFDRVQNASPYVSGTVVGGGVEGGYSQRSFSVHTGTGSSESFNCMEADCTGITGTGSTFHPVGGTGQQGNNFYVEAGSGARYNFAYRLAPPSTAPIQHPLYYLYGVNYPNGETITYVYDTAALGSATYRRAAYIYSNLGYYISISYHSNDFNDDGWFKLAVAAIYSNASPSTPIRWLTYSADGTTITDHGSRAFTDPGGRLYHCTGCANVLGNDLEVSTGSTQLPDETPQALQVAPVAGRNVVGSVTRDGVQWTYSYLNLRDSPIPFAYLFDRVTVNGPNGYHQVYEMAQTQRRNVITRVTDSINRPTSYLFDDAYRAYQVIYPEGNQVNVSYDAHGNLNWRRTRARLVGGQIDPAHPDIVETADFPETCTGVLCYRPTSSRDGRQQQTDYSYNTGGQLTERIDPPDANGVRRRTSTVYDVSSGISRPSVVRTCNDAGPLTTCGTNAPIQTEYDYWGNTLLPSVMRRIDVATATTLTTTFSYDAAGRLLSTDGPMAGSDDATYNRYDSYGRRTWEIGALAPNGLRIATRTTYRDADDKPVRVERGTIPDVASTVLTVLTQTDLAYDTRRNPMRETSSAGGTTYGVTDRSFDDRGLLVCTAVRMNPAAFATPVGACAPGAQGTGANDFGPDRITSNVYDAAGQRLQLREGVGTPAEGTEATWGYNANGQVTTVIDGNGNRAELRYDGYGRQDRWTFPAATYPPGFNFIDATPAFALATAGSVNAADYEEYGYDPNGNRISLRRRDNSTIGYQYDALNRLTAKIVPERSGLTAAQTRDVYYSYDLRNLQLSARFDSQSGEGVTNVYDGFGMLASTTVNMGGVTRALSYAYDAAGNRNYIKHPDVGSSFYTQFDPLNRPFYLESSATSLAYSAYFPSGALGVMHHGAYTVYGFDGAQRLNGLTHYLTGGAGGVIWSYGRNPAGQIVSAVRDNDAFAWTRHYGVNRNFTTNGLNQYSTIASTTSLGPDTLNLIYDANGNLVASGTQTYLYDVENRLVSSSNGSALVYDPLGRLFQVTGPVPGVGTTTTQFLYDGDALVAEYDAAGTMTHRYAHWVGADVPMVAYDTASLSTPHHLYTDHQGSIVASANADGLTLSVNSYDEYGFPGLNNTGRFQYTGQAWIPELGLYYYKARFYSPGLGRFMQTDPIGYQDQMNLYAYVSNDPTNGRDPEGTDSLWVQNPDGSTTVWIPINLTGGGVTPAATQSLIDRAAALNTGSSRVNFRIVPTDQPINGVLNRMDYSPGKDFSNYTQVGEGVNDIGGNYGHIDSSPTDASGHPRDPIGALLHDVLHLAGLPEGYTGGEGDGHGNRTPSQPIPGLTGTNIMRNRSGNSLNQSQIDQASGNRSSKQCHMEIDSRIPRCP
jgi:RHS repeat-associated protein